MRQAAIDFRLIGNLLCLFGHKLFPHCGNERLFTATWIQLLAFQPRSSSFSSRILTLEQTESPPRFQ
jgi:hypothetical protein